MSKQTVTYLVWDDEGRQALATLLGRLGGTLDKNVVVTTRDHLAVRLSHLSGLRIPCPNTPIGGVYAVSREGNKPANIAHRNVQYNHGAFMWEEGI